LALAARDRILWVMTMFRFMLPVDELAGFNFCVDFYNIF